MSYLSAPGSVAAPAEDQSVRRPLEKRALIVLNPCAGRGRARKVSDSLPALARELGWEVEQQATCEAGHEVELAAQAKRDGWPVVIAVGGDGTVHGVVNGLLSEGPCDTVLAHVPVGTGNDFAKTVKLNKARAAGHNLGQVLAGRVLRFDVGRALGEYFVNSMGIGFAAAAAHNLRKCKKLKGFAAYVATVYRTFLSFKAPELELRSREHHERGQILMVEIALGKTTGGGFTVTPDADPCDGLLDVCLIRDVGMLTFLRYVPRVIRGTHVGLWPVKVFRTRRAELESLSGPSLVHLDGEVRFSGAASVAVEIVPGCLPVLCAG